MAEADELCDRIAIVDHGRILAIGSPEELKQRVQRESIFRLELDRLDGGAAALARPARRRVGGPGRRGGRRRSTARPSAVNLVLEDDGALGGVVGALGGLGSHILALRKSEPSLEDVFVELVGRGFDDDDSARTAAIPATAAQRRRGRGTSSSMRSASRTRASWSDDVALRVPPQDQPGRGRPTGAGARCCSPTCGRSAAAPIRASPGCSARSRGSFFEILLPFLATSAFVFVYRALQAPPEYVGFVVLGGAMTAFWLNVIWMMAEPALLGEEPGQPRALLRGADEHHERSCSGWPSAGWS